MLAKWVELPLFQSFTVSYSQTSGGIGKTSLESLAMQCYSNFSMYRVPPFFLLYRHLYLSVSLYKIIIEGSIFIDYFMIFTCVICGKINCPSFFQQEMVSNNGYLEDCPLSKDDWELHVHG